MDNSSDKPAPQSTAPLSAQSRVLRLKEVCNVTGFGRSFIYQLQAEQRFPHSFKIGERAVGWLESEVQEWLKNRVHISRSQIKRTRQAV